MGSNNNLIYVVKEVEVRNRRNIGKSVKSSVCARKMPTKSLESATYRFLFFRLTCMA